MNNLMLLSHRMAHENITQREVASAIGVCDSTLSRILTGENMWPSSKVLCRLADYFDVSVDWLLSRVPTGPDGKLHEAESVLKDVKWNAFPDSRVHARFEWYYAENQLYVIHDKETDAYSFVRERSPAKAVEHVKKNIK